jgi:hypothetical protein
MHAWLSWNFIGQDLSHARDAKTWPRETHFTVEDEEQNDDSTNSRAAACFSRKRRSNCDCYQSTFQLVVADGLTLPKQ